jgi:hypothetical protein
VRCTAGYPTYPSGNPHGGEDYVPTNKRVESNWKLYSPSDGIVKVSKKEHGNYAGGYGAYGNYLVIQCDNGYWVLMAHMAQLPLVKEGERVKADQEVGLAGETGNVSGRHLHIEVSDMRGVDTNAITWYKKFIAHRVKPSNYIDFNNYEPTPPKPDEGDFEVKKWTNGSTTELVYQTTADCKAKKNHIGSLAPRESCECYGIVDGCYLLSYKVNGTTAMKCGFVAYAGGVKK